MSTLPDSDGLLTGVTDQYHPALLPGRRGWARRPGLQRATSPQNKWCALLPARPVLPQA